MSAKRILENTPLERSIVLDREIVPIQDVERDLARELIAVKQLNPTGRIKIPYSRDLNILLKQSRVLQPPQENISLGTLPQLRRGQSIRNAGTLLRW